MFAHYLVPVSVVLFCASTVSAQAPTEPVPPPPAPGSAADQMEVDIRATQDRLDAALLRISALEEQEAVEDTTEERFVLAPLVSSFTRLELRQGYDELGAGAPSCNGGDGDCFRWRARLGLDVTVPLSDTVKVRARFLPQFAGFWASGATSGGVTDPAVGLHEGSLLLTFDETIGLEIGRFEMSYGEQVVIGAVGWHPNSRSFDGLRLQLQPGEIKLDVFFTLLNEGNLPTLGESDAYFYGAYAGLGELVQEDLVLDVYLLAVQANRSMGADWSHLTHPGARFKHRFGMIDLRLEAGIQLGRQGTVPTADSNVIFAGHALAEVGFHVLPERLRLSLEGAVATGDDPTTDVQSGYSQLFPTAHGFLGLTDVMGPRSNVGTGVFHAQFKALPTLGIHFDAHLFLRPEAAETFTGFESDLHVIWKPLPGFRARAMYGMFVPNSDAWVGDNLVHYFEVEAGYDFN